MKVDKFGAGRCLMADYNLPRDTSSPARFWEWESSLKGMASFATLSTAPINRSARMGQLFVLSSAPSHTPERMSTGPSVYGPVVLNSAMANSILVSRRRRVADGRWERHDGRAWAGWQGFVIGLPKGMHRRRLNATFAVKVMRGVTTLNIRMR